MNTASFWDVTDRTLENEAKASPRMIQEAEQQLGYRLPADYLELIKTQNGGKPKKNYFPVKAHAKWPDEYVEIMGICGVGGKWGVDSAQLGSKFFIREWGYPDIGVIVGHGPSAGHDAIMLDYSASGSEGEPRVVHVDVESGDQPVIRVLAETFSLFLKGLVSAVDSGGGPDALARVRSGVFSPLLRELCARTVCMKHAEKTVRSVAQEIVMEKGQFSLHGDELSQLMYDLQFLLYANANVITSKEEYFAVYPQILVTGSGFSTGGYAKGFLEQWFDRHIRNGVIIKQSASALTGPSRLAFTEEYAESVVVRAESVATQSGKAKTAAKKSGPPKKKATKRKKS